MNSALEGFIAAPFAPMNDDGSLSLDTVEPYADLLLRNGVAGVFVNGTTGEGVSLDPEERMRLAQRWIEVVPDDFPVIVHVGHNSVEINKTLTIHAREIGATAIAAMGPSFFKPKTVDDLVAFCREIAAQAPDLPFFYYHIPEITGVSLPMVDFLHVAGAEIPSLAGIKFSDTDLVDFGLSLALEGGRFQMLFGCDEILLSALVLGARGAVGSTYNFMVPLYHDLLAAFQKGDLETARDRQRRAMVLIRLIEDFTGTFLPAAKGVMKFIGVDCGPVRLPLRRLTVAQESQLRAEVDELGFFDFCSK